MQRFLSALVFTIIGGASGSLSLLAAIDTPVHLDTGMVSGAAGTDPDVRVFKGLPFAAPPVGNLRWHAPQAVAHWDGIRKADEFGPMCMQAAGRGGAAAKRRSQAGHSGWRFSRRSQYR
jgi:hypothetical protein